LSASGAIEEAPILRPSVIGHDGIRPTKHLALGPAERPGGGRIPRLDVVLRVELDDRQRRGLDQRTKALTRLPQRLVYPLLLLEEMPQLLGAFAHPLLQLVVRGPHAGLGAAAF